MHFCFAIYHAKTYTIQFQSIHGVACGVCILGSFTLYLFPEAEELPELKDFPEPEEWDPEEWELCPDECDP